MASFDAIVIGLGAMGSAALYELARRGLRALGIERFDIGHDRGSSHGETRLIRRAYFEDPRYVPLVDRSYAAWEELERTTRQKLLHRCGLFLAGVREERILAGVLRAAAEHRMNIEFVPPADWPARFPQFRPDPAMQVLFESDAGFLRVEACVRTYVESAREAGAQVVTGRRVERWTADSAGVTVVADGERYTAAALVLCAGAWSQQLLSPLRLPLTVRRKVIVWISDGASAYQCDSGCPAFGFDTPGGFFYGFPSINELGVKIGNHSGDETSVAADAIDRHVRSDEEDPIRRFAATHLPRLASTVTKRSVCMYTMTPDEHFIVDRHPEHSNVAIACGFSGHGFKFAPVIGSALADLATTGRTAEPIDFLRCDRPALRSGPPR